MEQRAQQHLNTKITLDENIPVSETDLATYFKKVADSLKGLTTRSLGVPV